MKLLRKRRVESAKARPSTYDIYFASDIHGSEQCWRKFLGAGRHYGVNALVMGGDLTGKAVVPITHRPEGGYECRFLGETRQARSDDQLHELLQAIRYNGMYPWVALAEEIERHQNDSRARGVLFEKLMLGELKRWMDIADERMSTTGIDVFVMAGNDDIWPCDDVVSSARYVQPCDSRVVRVGSHEMISCSYSNLTPWKGPREINEDALYKQIKQLAEQIEDPSTAIFTLHVPPYDSGLDRAYRVHDDLTVAYVGGQPQEVPVGSTAVRQIIEEYQPLVSLHGHVHESRGATHIGRTLALNPGSEYNSGRVHGVVVKLAPQEVIAHDFLTG